VGLKAERGGLLSREQQTGGKYVVVYDGVVFRRVFCCRQALSWGQLCWFVADKGVGCSKDVRDRWFYCSVWKWCKVKVFFFV